MISDFPAVSIIVPTFNKSELLKETIKSVIEQTYQNWECIIVDDDSTENNLQLVSEFSKIDKRISFFSRSDFAKPKGANSCRNIGIENAKGNYLIFLDGDDVLLPICLAQRVKFMESNPHLDFAVFQMQLRDEDLNYIESKPIVKFKENYLEAFLSHEIPWAITCPILKLQTVKKVKGFDESFPRLQDPELFIKILLLENISFQVLENSEVDSYYRVPKNKKINLESALTGFLMYYKKFQPIIPHNYHPAIKKGIEYAYNYHKKYSKSTNSNFQNKIKICKLVIYAYQNNIFTLSDCIKRCGYIFLKT